MTLLLKSLLGIGAFTTSSVVALVSSKSLWNNVESSAISEKVHVALDESSSQGGSEEKVTDLAVSSDSGEIKAPEETHNKIVVEQITTLHSSAASSRNLSEAEKYKDRIDHPELCKVILSSKIDNSKVQVCRSSRDSSGLEFEYHTGVIGEMPIPVKDLRYTYNQLVVNLTKEDSLGLSSKRLDLSDDIIAGKGLIPMSDVSNKNFTHEQCQLKSIDIQKAEWNIGCQVASI